MVIGANWNGARSFTSTSGAGVSLMSEFLGLAYFSEVPVVLINVQRGGPSTGMPTRTQQSDISICAYASHGDTKHILLFPSDPAECFDQTVKAFDLSDGLQTPIIVMSDLDLGMNSHLSPTLKWDNDYKYNLGKVLDKKQLDEIENYGRYKDVDGDGICYRTIPGTHPTKGAFVTRGTSRDEYAKYTEESAEYLYNIDRLLLKWETAKSLVPGPVFYQDENKSKAGIICFGTSLSSTLEAKDLLAKEENEMNLMCVKAFPFNKDVIKFIASHDKVFVVEQNRDAQFKSLLTNEINIKHGKLFSVLQYDGMPITASEIIGQINTILESKEIVEAI
jgi:2-oxoglutarate ferredoxin oxidoreductase subunit alpha